MPASQPERYTRNVITSYLNATVMALVAFLVTPLLTRHLGVAGFGVWVLIGALIPYFELLEMGFANSTIAYVARHLETGEKEMIHRTLNTSFFVLVIPGLFVAGIVVVVAIYLPDIIPSIPDDLVVQARILLLLLAFDMAVSIPMDTFGGALIALQRYDLLNVSLIVVTLLQALGWFIVLEMHGGLVALGVVTVSISLCGQLARFLIARSLIPRLSVSFRAFDRGILRSFFGLSGWFSLSEISMAVIGGVDVIIVGIVVGVRGAAIYAVGQRIASLPAQACGPPAAVVFPYAGVLAGRGDRQGMRNVTESVTRQVMALAIPASLAVILLAVPAVRAWVGPSYHQSAEVAALLAAAVVFQALALTPRAVIAGSGQPKLPTVITVVEAVVRIGLSVWLCHVFGLIGAAVTALILAVTLEGFVLLPLLYRKLKMPLVALLLRLLRAHAIPIVVAGAIGWLLAHYVLDSFVRDHSRPAGLASIVLAGLAVVAPYYALLAFTGTSNEERVVLMARVKALLPGMSR